MSNIIETREFEIDGVNFVANRTNPYGFWTISLEGNTFTGQYTSFEDVEEGAKRLIQDKKVANG